MHVCIITKYSFLVDILHSETVISFQTEELTLSQSLTYTSISTLQLHGDLQGLFLDGH